MHRILVTTKTTTTRHLDKRNCLSIRLSAPRHGYSATLFCILFCAIIGIREVASHTPVLRWVIVTAYGLVPAMFDMEVARFSERRRHQLGPAGVLTQLLSYTGGRPMAWRRWAWLRGAIRSHLSCTSGEVFCSIWTKVTSSFQ